MAITDINELFERTLVGDYDDDEPWNAVRELRRLGTREVFEFAANWCGSATLLMRARGLDVLAQLGRTADHHENNFAEESYAVVAGTVEKETDLRALESGIYALGHLYDPQAIPLVVSCHRHPSPDIRFAVAYALGSFPDDPRIIEPMLVLMEDTDEDVRDWATFGLGDQGSQDSDEIREALFRRLTDDFSDVREEAIVSLAKRKDLRVLPFLFKALEKEKVCVLVIEAACGLLDFDSDREDWTTHDYLKALRERFSE